MDRAGRRRPGDAERAGAGDDRHGEAAGTAAALLGAVQFGVGALAAPLVGVLGTGSLAMGVVVAGCMAGATAVMLLVVRPRRMVAAEVVPVAA